MWIGVMIDKEKLLEFIFSHRFLRLFLLGCILVILVLLYTLHIPHIETSHKFSAYDLNFTTNQLRPSIVKDQIIVNSLPIILLWTDHYSIRGNWIPNLRSLDCPMECQITSNKKLVQNSAAVIFHLRSTYVNALPPWNKYGNQKWVLFNGEAPPNTPMKILRGLEGKIHWTATYRRDSDFYVPYGVLVPPTNATQTSTEFNSTEDKAHLVCWIVSHCHTASQRESYVSILSKYVSIVIYGNCGTETCPNSNASNCYHYISKKCKFYLSFENSICPDYATEKLFFALETDMVPIVMGGDNYSLTLPAHSYINAMDFLNPKDLATYLLELDKDPEKYKEYHMWKLKYKVVNIDYEWACDLCQRLHNDSGTPVSTYKNLSSWWFNPKCHAWAEVIKDR